MRSQENGLYTPNLNFNGNDTFTVTITDDDGHTATQDIFISLAAVDDDATISGDTEGFGVEGSTITGTLTAIDNADGLTDGAYFSITSNPSNGYAAIHEGIGPMVLLSNRIQLQRG